LPVQARIIATWPLLALGDHCGGKVDGVQPFDVRDVRQQAERQIAGAAARIEDCRWAGDEQTGQYAE